MSDPISELESFMDKGCVFDKKLMGKLLKSLERKNISCYDEIEKDTICDL